MTQVALNYQRLLLQATWKESRRECREALQILPILNSHLTKLIKLHTIVSRRVRSVAEASKNGTV
jgi:hypothetical protein